MHVEKAFFDVTGAYPMINRTFLEHEAAGLQYVNREDDAGDEGLRKAKLSYHPAYMLENIWQFHDKCFSLQPIFKNRWVYINEKN